jgi:glycosyltransferase involved in cell wall biosynthesis/SAM-dependent methyltransferase
VKRMYERLEDGRESALLPEGWEALLLANSFTAVPQASGGTKHFLKLAGNWSEEGQRLTVLTTGMGRENCEMEGFPGPFRELAGRWPDRLPAMAMYAVRAVQAIFSMPAGGRKTLLYGTSDMLPDVLPAFVRSALHVRESFWVNCVFHLVPAPSDRQGPALTNYASFLGQRVGLRLIRRGADVLVVDNEMVREQLIGLGFSPGRVFVTRMGTAVPGDLIARAPAEFEACFLGRLHPSKGVFELVDIWRRVCEARPGSRLAVMGAGPRELVEALEVDIRRQGLEGLVTLMGHVSRQELEEVLSQSRVFAFPSHEEGFGISILEAMAFGLPVVAYDLAHYAGIFGGVIKTVPLGDVDSFAAEINGLLADEGLRLSAGSASRELASRFTWGEVSHREAAHIAGALRGREGVRPITLICPACLEQGREVPLGDLRELAGGPDLELSCGECAETYPVAGGIPVMVPGPLRMDQNLPEARPTSEHLAYGTRATPAVARLVKRFSASTSLDVGCGKGPYSGYYNGEVVLADVNHFFVSEAVRAYAGPHRAFGVVADARALPFAAGSFPFVLCSSMVEHLPPGSLDRALSSLKSIAGDRLIIDVPNDLGLVAAARRLLTGAGVFEETDYDDRALDHGIRFSARALKEKGFEVRGCIGWVTRERVPVGSLWDVYDLLARGAPALAGTLIGTYRK